MRDNLLVSSLQYLYEEHKTNSKIILKLSTETMKQQTLRTSLGIGWVLFRDLVYFTAFILFRYLMSGSGTIDGMNFILFLLLGIIPWNFMSECINGAVGTIKWNKAVLGSLKFPIVILPTIEVMAIFLKRFFTIIILLIVVTVFGDISNVRWLVLAYYCLCMLIFMIIWNQVFSALVAISNDFEQLYGAVASILFYTLPIMWSFETLSNATIIRIFKLNPFIYIIEGFRDACVRGKSPDLEYTIYFWGISVVLLCIGSILQYKLRRHYVDMI